MHNRPDGYSVQTFDTAAQRDAMRAQLRAAAFVPLHDIFYANAELVSSAADATELVMLKVGM